MSEERIDHMKYLPQMENIGSEIQDKVISEMENYDPNKYTANDVLEALKHDNITPEDFKALLSPAALPLLEQIAQKAQVETRKHFGNSIYMFTPCLLYTSSNGGLIYRKAVHYLYVA